MSDRPNRTRRALAVAAVGGVLMLIGIVGWIVDGRSGSAGAAAGTTGATTTTTTVAAAATVTEAPPATEPPVATSSSTTTTQPPETLEAFVAAYNNALADGDTDFLFDRLHPTVIDIHGADTCGAFVENTILLLSDYRLLGPVEGPAPRVIQTTEGQVTVEVLTAPVGFVFQGQDVTASGDFALVDGQVRWFTNCS